MDDDLETFHFLNTFDGTYLNLAVGFLCDVECFETCYDSDDCWFVNYLQISENIKEVVK